MFIILPVGVDHTTKDYPVVTFTMMGLCTVLFLTLFGLQLGYGDGVVDWEFEHLWYTPAHSGFLSCLTSLFVHGGWLHLIGNMIYLFLFGAAVEDVMGRGKFLLLYLVGGVVAVWINTLVTPSSFASEQPLGGASGAISACIGAFLPYFWKTKIEFKYFWFLFIRFGSGGFFLPAWVVIAFWFVSDLLGTMRQANASESEGGTAFAAHIGGMVVGLVAGSFGKWLQSKREKREQDIEPSEDLDRDLPATILLYFNNEQHGPFNRVQITEMYQLGSIPPEAQFWCEGMSAWQPVSSLMQASQ